MHRGHKLILPQNRSRSSQGHVLYKLLELHSLTLHARFQIPRPCGFGEKDFSKRILLFIALAAILVMWPELFISTFIFSFQEGYIRNLGLIGQMNSEGKVFEHCEGRRHDDARSYPFYISAFHEPSASSSSIPSVHVFSFI